MMNFIGSTQYMFALGYHVKKSSGYNFRGVVRSVFINGAGEIRYVVESNVAGTEGWLMIFNEKQLQHATEPS